MKSSFASSLYKGFTLIEVVIGAALFVLIALAIYQSYATLSSLVGTAITKVTATDLVNEQLEIVRNLPYAQVGLVGGIPAGVLNHTKTFVRNGITFYATTTIRNIDDPFDGRAGGSPNDLSPADYKMVEIDIGCPSCKNFSEMDVTTRVGAKSLESASTNGALFIKVFDGNGQPVVNANVHVANTALSPAISIDDVTDNNGMLQIVDAPPSNNSYHVTVSKSGYTSDQTYPVTGGNPHPTKPDATVALQQVTQVSFTIDKVSTLSISAVSDTCTPVPSLSFNLTGTKLIGTNPNTPKYNQTLTLNGSGQYTVPNFEWDTYSLSLNGSNYWLAGTNPLIPVSVLPNSTQNVQLIVTSGSPDVLMASVTEGNSGLPLSGATVSLTKTGYSSSLVTGLGSLSQTDWSGGVGQGTIGDPTKYFASDGNVSVNSPIGDLTLNKIFGLYASSGNLTSSTFDTGTTSNYSQITWAPLSQPPQTGSPNVQFQIASNNDNTTWNFVGPNGSSGTYYDITNNNVSSANANTRYFRYKIFLDTASTTYSPDISNVALTFTSACVPPGQVVYTGLSAGTYNISVSKSGHTTYSGTVSVGSSWQQTQVNLSP
jgi:prepilin-type N-terminal cleavage/methylation domain-containing protein